MRGILMLFLLCSGAALWAGPSPYGEIVIDGRLYDVRYYDHRGEPQFLKVRRDVASDWPVVDWYGGAPYRLNGKIGMLFKEGVSVAARRALLKRLDLTVEHNPVRAPEYYLAAMKKGVDPFQLTEDIRQSALVEWVQPDWEMELRSYEEPTPVVPDDTYYAQQWHHQKIRSELAWAIMPAGYAPVSIAIVDSGTDMAHPDLIDNLIPAAAYDFVDMDADPSPAKLAPLAGYVSQQLAAHGTCVAGLAAARGNNAKGVAGVCWDCDIVPVRLIDNTGNGTAQQPPKDTSSQVLAALMFAVDSGAAVINNSWGPANPDCNKAPFNNFVEYGNIYAAKKGRGGLGAAMVWAAGNDYCDTDNFPNLANDHIIVVGAMRHNTLGDAADIGKGFKATYSNYGKGITVVAPAGDPIDNAPYKGLMTTDISGAPGYEPTDYISLQPFPGTSAAAPVVAGAVALMLSAKPDMPLADALRCIRQAAVATRQARIDAGDLFDHNIINKDKQVVGACEWGERSDPYLSGATPHSNCFGYGYLDVYEMVRMALAGECDGWQIPACVGDGDCPEGQRCDAASGRCFLIKTCTDDSECLSGNCDEESGVCVGSIVADEDTAAPDNDDYPTDGPWPDDDTAFSDGQPLPDEAAVADNDQFDPTDQSDPSDPSALSDNEPALDDDAVLLEEPVGCGCSLI